MKLDQCSALAADQMVVLRIAVVVLIHVSVIGPGDFAQQSGFFEIRQRPVDCGTADATTVFAQREPFHQLVRVEVFVIGKHFIDNDRTFLRETFSLRCKEFAEFVDR